MTYRYPVRISREAKGGGLTVTFPDLPDAVTCGETIEAALAAAVDCLDEVLASHIRLGKEIPSPSKAKKFSVVPSIGIAAKAALYDSFRSSDLRKGELARQLNVNETEIRRMFDPLHPTKISRIEKALGVLGKRISLTIEDAL